MSDSNETNIIDSICSDLEQISVKIEELKSQQATLNALLLDSAHSEIDAQLSDKDYGAGTATVSSEAFKVKVTVPKRVKWDNNKLAEVEQYLVQRGEDPREYIEVKRSVSENAYNNWPCALKTMFIDARTVETSSPAIKIERK